jgi:holo-[acyl-carrier protein] synthase
VFAPLDIEVLGGSGEVGLELHGAARERAGELGVEVDISMTHTRGMAAAVAILR